jgi:nitroreductase
MRPSLSPALSLFLTFLCAASFSTFAAPDSTISLPRPQLDKGKSLMQALQLRHSTREFSSRPVPLQELANLLWAGCGVNRPETNGRTAPSARNKQEIDLFVALADGFYRYDAKAGALRLVQAGDVRSLTGTQPFVKDAPVEIVLAFDRKRGEGNTKYASADAAYISENLYLYCASEGLATVVRASVDTAALGAAVHINQTHDIIFAQSVGYPKVDPRDSKAK